MPISHSRRAKSRLVLLMTSGLFFGLVAWIGFRIFQPVEVPQMLPSQQPVSFNADKTIESNPLFQTLQVFVQGDYVVGSIGNPYPLGGDPKKKTPKGYDNKSLLATSEEVALNGIFVKDITLANDGGIVSLLYNGTSDGKIHYEVRMMGGAEEKTVAQWNADPKPDLRVAGLTQDPSGTIWLVNEQGQVGRLNADGTAVWLESIQTGLRVQDPRKLSIAADNLDRVWIMDESVVSVGTERGFSPVNLVGELSTEEQTAYQSLLLSQAAAIGLPENQPSDEALRAALAPKAFYPLGDGRMGLITAYGAFVFSQSQAARAEWIPTLQYSLIPQGISDKGDVWGFRYTDHILSYIQGATDRPFSSGPAPSADFMKPASLVFSDGTAFVLEQAQKSTNLWSSSGEDWSVKLISTTGTQSVIAPPQKIRMDSEGVMWSLMSDGHLYRITAGAVVESPATNL